MPNNPQEILAPIGLAVGAFTAFMPHISEVRASTTSDKDMEKNLRTAEYSSAFVVFGACAVVAMWTHEYYPLVIGGIAVLALIYLFETVYRTVP